MSAKQKNQMAVLSALTGAARPELSALDQAAANRWISRQWDVYMHGGERPEL